MSTAPSTPQGVRISPEQVRNYNEQGYVLFNEPVFSPGKFARLQTIFEEHLSQYGAENLDLIHLRDPRLLEFLLSDELLDLVEPLVGSNIGLWSSGFISKEPFSGAATPWHEDSAYWDGLISTMNGICTVWLAIDPATRENGCMKVIPGTHTAVGGFSEYEETAEVALNIFGRQIKPESIDESKAIYFELAPNECSLHEARIIHGADANTSPQRRCGYTMRYFPTSSKVHLEKIPWDHKLWLARGRDIAGNRYANTD